MEFFKLIEQVASECPLIFYLAVLLYFVLFWGEAIDYFRVLSDEDEYCMALLEPLSAL